MVDKVKSKIPLLCPQGKTFSRVFVGNTLEGAQWDLTGWSAHIQIRTSLPSNDDSVLIAEFFDGDGLEIITENGASKVVWTIDADVTASFDVGSYIWELELESPTGFVPYLMAPSKFKVLAENTVSS